MEIYGIGTDIIEIARVKKAIKRSKNFKNRVYTEVESRYCEDKGKQKFESYASRFAAKEAIAKSLGTGLGKDLVLKEIEITEETAGRPGARLHGKSKEYAESLAIKEIKISISAIKDYALAYALSLI